ncbi:MAG TPA: hypothetical protein DEF48_04115 [Nostoc sp. UBA8866]|nr:hypothetical protein [Nostoc sp. UBA8866]
MVFSFATDNIPNTNSYEIKNKIDNSSGRRWEDRSFHVWGWGVEKPREQGAGCKGDKLREKHSICLQHSAPLL